MTVIILRDQPDDGRWMRCQYGHHETCGGAELDHPVLKHKPPCTCSCHQPPQEKTP